jgi:hypothetical protein
MQELFCAINLILAKQGFLKKEHKFSPKKKNIENKMTN